MFQRILTPFVIAILLATSFSVSVSAQRRRPDPNRRIPMEGVEVSQETRAELESGLSELGQQLAQIRQHEDSWVQGLAADIEIFHRAVAQALEHREFLSPRDLAAAPRLLEEGQARAQALLGGEAPWTKQPGLVALGYVSKLDDTVQPYGLLIPDRHAQASSRLDIWLHGRNESICEVGFLNQQLRGRVRVSPQNAFVLFPFGRYSNAFRFAGEVDVWESLADAQRRFRIDEDRISIRGFSMGGAGCWHLALHHPDRFFAANPGAGFSETAEFLGIYRSRNGRTPEAPPWYQVKLWNLHDGPGHAINLLHCPTIAYSGENDRQKQAADVMENALDELGIDMVHVIGPQTGHQIHPDSQIEIEQRLASLAKRGRQQLPRRVRFATYTLKYNRLNWIQIDGLEEHWEQARVDAAIEGPSKIVVATSNVNELTLSFDPGWSPFEIDRAVQVEIDGRLLEAPRPMSDRSWRGQFHRDGDSWRTGPADETGLRKRHGLQGPIDDAFMDSFLIVRPTGESSNPRFQAWSESELAHAVAHWRQHFRGDARVKDDDQVSDDDLANHHLILFGDAESNKLIEQIAGSLPLGWEADSITAGDRKYASADHALVMVYPNPLNRSRYVVLNSGFTFREYAYYNNARQTPKLPDWAIVDLGEPANNRTPGKIVAADFFDEAWQLRE